MPTNWEKEAMIQRGERALFGARATIHGAVDRYATSLSRMRHVMLKTRGEGIIRHLTAHLNKHGDFSDLEIKIAEQSLDEGNMTYSMLRDPIVNGLVTWRPAGQVVQEGHLFSTPYDGLYVLKKIADAATTNHYYDYVLVGDGFLAGTKSSGVFFVGPDNNFAAKKV